MWLASPPPSSTLVTITGECYAKGIPGTYMRNKMEQFVLSQQATALKMQMNEMRKRLERRKKDA